MADPRQRCKKLIARKEYARAIELAETMCEEARLDRDSKSLQEWTGRLAEAGAAIGAPYYQAFLGQQAALVSDQSWMPGSARGSQFRATALMGAAAGGRIGLVSELLSRGAPVDQAHEESRLTALMYAAYGNHAEILRLLVQHGADLEARDRSSSTALYHAAAGLHLEAVRALLELGAQVSSPAMNNLALHRAAEGGSAELLRLLIEHGADPSFPDGAGQTPLHRAASHPHPSGVRALLDLGSDPVCRDRSGRAPLHLAASGGWIGEIRLLVPCSGVDLRTTEGLTPLMEATLKGHTQAIKILKELGADSEARDQAGHSIAYYRQRYEYNEYMEDGSSQIEWRGLT